MDAFDQLELIVIVTFVACHRLLVSNIHPESYSSSDYFYFYLTPIHHVYASKHDYNSY